MKAYDQLHRSVRTGGVGLTLTINEGRSFNFRLPSIEDYERSKDYDGSMYKQNTYLLASCLVEAGGFTIPPSMLLDKIEYIEGFGTQLYRRMVYGLSYYIGKSIETEAYFEAFCYENMSRNLWFTWKQSNSLGYPMDYRDYPLTPLQVNWIAYNVMEDEREKIHHAWTHSFFVASSMNPKGVEKVRQKWEEADKKEKDYRVQVMEAARKGLKLSDEQKDRIAQTKTIEDLQREYRSWVDGEEDEHDRLVGRYKDYVMGQIQQRNVRDRAAEHNATAGELLSALQASSSIGSPIRTLSDDEVARIAAEKARNRGVVNEMSEYDTKVKHLLNPKFTQEPPPSLMDQISNRKVT